MKNDLPALLASILLLWSCSKPTAEISATAADSVITTVSSVVEPVNSPEPDTAFANGESTDSERGYSDNDYEPEENYQDGNGLSRQDENGVVHFANNDDVSWRSFPVSMFNENDDAINDVPAYLQARGIEFNLEKTEASSDPDDYESTDTYVYTFGESRIEIAYGDVMSAEIYSDKIELQDGVKVGMTKDDFIARFPEARAFPDADEFRLHPYPFAAFCFMTFSFEDGKIKGIKLEIAPQDCG